MLSYAIKHDFFVKRLFFASYEKDSSHSKNTESVCSCVSWPMKALLFSYGKHMSMSVVRKLVTMSESLHHLQPITLSATVAERELEGRNVATVPTKVLHYTQMEKWLKAVCWCLCGVKRTVVLAGKSLIRNPCVRERDPPDKGAQPDAHRHDFIRGHTRAESGASPHTHTPPLGGGGGWSENDRDSSVPCANPVNLFLLSNLSPPSRT